MAKITKKPETVPVIGEDTEQVYAAEGRTEEVSFEPEADDGMSAEERKAYDNTKFKVRIKNTLKIKRKIYHPGVHTAARGLAEVLTEMDDKLTRNKLSVHVGKSFMLEHLIDGSVAVKEVQDLAASLRKA